jgi:HK97 family phage major capsid protein
VNDIQTYSDEAARLYNEAKALLVKEDADAEDAEQRDKLMQAAGKAKKAAADLAEIEQFATNHQAKGKKPEPEPAKFKSIGEMFQAIRQYYNPTYRGRTHPALTGQEWDDPEEKGADNLAWQRGQRKDLVESVGATGGFLVPVEFRNELLQVVYETNPIRERATIIPMRHRQVDIPVLDQTQGAVGVSAQHGGIVATWTEEAAQKDETEPQFRQVQLVAHKLVCYTEVSDELLADEAVGLVQFLNGPGGFAGAIRWEEEWTFLQGTGDGQPFGVIGAPGTIVHPRQTTGQVNIDDLFNMIMQHHGENPIWHINRSTMVQIFQLAGPAANPTYVWMANARDSLPMSLFGYPIHWTEKCPNLDDPGDVVLADWRYYLIGDRQAITIASSTDFRFRNDLTAWRAVHRVDGQPWLSEPITLADGVDLISPFVILGGGGS